jgi:hypothetical protein
MTTSFNKERLDRLLLALVGTKELVERWWKSPNRAFYNQPPEVVFEESPCLVINYILNQFHH